MREFPIQQRIMLALGTGLTRLFRVNTGTAWQGKGKAEPIRRPTQVMCYPGDVVIRQAQPIRMGLCTGGSDLVGWTSHTVSDCDVGTVLAIFTAIEVKSDTGRATPEQLNFIEQVRKAGGIAGVARSEAEAREIIANSC